ncbi:MAG: hypothetical protein AAF560_03305 [Acidobacteriota bacterium]
MTTTDDATQVDKDRQVDRDQGRSDDASTSDHVSTSSRASQPYLSFLTLAATILAVLIALGIIPTRRLAGENAQAALIAGCAISFIAALVGTLPIVLARGKTASNTVPAVMGSIALRTTVVLLLGFAAVQSGWFEPKPLLIWIVLSHASLQLADIRFTKQVLYTSRS